MEVMGLKLTPVVVRHLLAFHVHLDLWLALLGLIASPNSSNGRFNPPPAPHLSHYGPAYFASIMLCCSALKSYLLCSRTRIVVRLLYYLYTSLHKQYTT